MSKPKIKLADIAPYKSFTAFEAREGVIDRRLFAGLREEVGRIVSDTAKRAGGSAAVEPPIPVSDSDRGTIFGILHYVQRQPASWTLSDEGPIDTINHLIVLGALGNVLLVCVTDKPLATKLAEVCEDEKATYGAWSKLRRYSSLDLNGLIKGRPSRTLWLSGLHRSVSVKADNKVLCGIDLRDALDPLGDQTYQFTSARSGGHKKKLEVDTIGVSPHRAKIWIGPSRQWEEFQRQADLLLANLQSRHASRRPLPVLAIEARPNEAFREAFDVVFIPPESMIDSDPDMGKRAEAWAAEGAWKVVESKDKDFTLEVNHSGTLLGRVRFTFELFGDAWRPKIASTGSDPGDPELFREFVELCRHRELLKVYYESQHTYSHGHFYKSSITPVPFKEFAFDSFNGIEITAEKPYTWKVPPGKTKRIKVEDKGRIGDPTDNSLFGWCVRTFRRGWLWCDDGSGEIADFIHLDDSKMPPVLRLIHVKAAHSADSNRQLSVSPYEIVCAQALKNLRHLETSDLTESLGKKISLVKIQRAWRNGTPLPPAQWAKLPDAIANVPYHELSREVLVVQPHVTSTMIAGTTDGSTSAGRKAQLDTLLNATRAEVYRHMARFVVYVAK